MRDSSGQTSSFDRETTLRSLGDGRFEATISQEWYLIIGANGGLTASLLARAAAAGLGEPSQSLRTCTVHFVSALTEGIAQLETTVTARARTVSFVRAVVHQAGRLVGYANAVYGSDRPARFAYDNVIVPAAPPPDELPLLSIEAELDIPIRDRWEIRALPTTTNGGGETPPDGPVQTMGWIRLTEPRPFDEPLLVAMSDAFPPPLFTLPDRPPVSVPTLELTVHLRGLEAMSELEPTDWCFGRFRSDVSQEGFIDEDGEIWDRHGRLLVRSRQLAVVARQPQPRGD